MSLAPSAWHTSPVEALTDRLDTRLPDGLTAAAAAARLATAGPNLITEGRRRGPGRILLDQFADVMILLLLAAARPATAPPTAKMLQNARMGLSRPFGHCMGDARWGNAVG